MANVLHLHEMIDALSELAEIEGKGSFLGVIALEGLQNAERALKGATVALTRFENQDFASADDSVKKHNTKEYNDDFMELRNVEVSIIDRIQHLVDIFKYICEVDKSLNNEIVKGHIISTLEKVSDDLVEASTTLDAMMRDLRSESMITINNLQAMAILASEFDKSDDPLLMKQAALLDEILLTIGAQKTAVMAARRAQDEEISRLKALAETKEKDPYTLSKEVHDKSNNVVEAQKAIDKIKEYRPMEAPLNTRTCPDHPGAQMARIAEHTYQCSLDKSVYNYDTGYTTMKGNNVPGGNVSNQTQSLHDRPNEFTSFETRENKLNPTN